MTLHVRITRTSAAVLAILGLAAALALAPLTSAEAQKSPAANKFAVAGEGLLIEMDGSDPAREGITLLSTTMKNPGSKALVLGVTLECSILTSLMTIGDDLSQSEAKAEVWVEVNGTTVAYADDVADGKVTFCEREYQRETSGWDDDDAVIDDFIRTKASHGFNWVALHDGSGEKLIEVKANLTTNQTSNATTALAIGARTLTVEPVDVARDESLDN